MSSVQDLLCWGTPRMDWTPYNEHGGAVDDALTFELLQEVSCVRPLGVKLFNPKLVVAGMPSRRPNIYFNSIVHCYVECLLTRANTETARQGVEKHILRVFFLVATKRHTLKSRMPSLQFCTIKIGETLLCNWRTHLVCSVSMRESLLS